MMNIDILREHSVKNMDAGKGIANYIANELPKESSVKATQNGFVVDSVRPNSMSPIYGKPQDEDKTIAEQVEAGKGTSAEQRKNALAVLASTSTPEELKKMEEDGFAPGDTDAHTIVTVTDQIKVNMAKTGGKVTGDLSKEELEEITGNAAMASQLARAFETAEAMQGQPLSEDEMLYLVKNEQAPTLENVYYAMHSAGIPASNNEISQSIQNDPALKKQVDQVIASANMEVNETSEKYAATLLERQIALTAENLDYYAALHQLAGGIPGMEEVAEAAMDAVAEGKSPSEAMLIKGYSMVDQAKEAYDVIQSADEEDLVYCLDNSLEINIENLKEAEKAREGQRQPLDMSKWQNDISMITAKRMLEETRLAMTTEANLALIKRGFAIDTKPLEEVVNQLKDLENNYYANLLEQEEIAPTQENVARFADTMDALAQLKQAPASILQISDKEDSLRSLEEKAQSVAAEYEKLWTAPRADMGDSIRKAFQNVDDILVDLGQDVSEENRRAVRILAYNESEITEENIAVIREKDALMQRTFANMTPKATLELIRRGENPIDLPLEELNQKVEEIRSENPDNDRASFEKFLYKLEQNHQISEEERSSYIGIYRLIAQVEKGDGAALGAALNQGSDITMRSLLTQIRNQTKQGMNYTVDDLFSGVEAKTQGAKIDSQIEAAFAEGPTTEENAYEKEQLSEMAKASEAKLEAYEELIHLKMPASVNNVLAMQQMLTKPGKAIEDIWNAKDSLADAKAKLMERFGEAVKSPTELADALETLEEVAEHCLDEAVEQSPDPSYVDIKALRLAAKQITIARKQADEESFLIPVETSDGVVTGVSLKVVRSSGKKGLVDIMFESAGLGKVQASFEAKEDRISGLVMCNQQTSRDMLAEQIPGLAEELMQAVNEQVDISVAFGKDLSERQAIRGQEKPSDENPAEREIQTRRLYQIAETFIKFVSQA